LVRLEASTKPHVHKKIHEFLINVVVTIAYLNFKKGLKRTFGPLGIKHKYNVGTMVIMIKDNII
jgi:hypothetical protein